MWFVILFVGVIVGFGLLGFALRDAFEWQRVWVVGIVVASSVAVIGIFLSGWSAAMAILAPVAWGSFYATAGRTLVGWQGEK